MSNDLPKTLLKLLPPKMNTALQTRIGTTKHKRIKD